MHVTIKFFLFFLFKQKTAYEMRISDWSSDVCSSDLGRKGRCQQIARELVLAVLHAGQEEAAQKLPQPLVQQGARERFRITQDRQHVLIFEQCEYLSAQIRIVRL